ncbi:hypothetical protein [Hydrogenophaga sp. PBC]|uniref:hypothetical protein n=1 Tax=Hydrogenophaga sp. PBC TaxID=795665 RepID=UPI000A0455C9|nr:hypothetical protein [Hydrogenophaga sp. PBC]
MLSAFSVERCPPSRWNTVRHQHGIVSAIAWNTHLGEGPRPVAQVLEHLHRDDAVEALVGLESGSPR